MFGRGTRRGGPWALVAVTVFAGVVSAGCTDGSAAVGSAASSPNSGSTSGADPVTSAAPDPRSTPTVARAIPVTPLYPAGDIDPGLAPFIDQATVDLAALLDVPATDIGTHAAVLVVWPDASLGCPQKDMRYKQVPTDGSVIELTHQGTTYRYHTGGTRGPFQCPVPLLKAPGGEGPSLGSG